MTPEEAAENNANERSARYELDVLARAREMREADLVAFIRETVVRLEVLADRLEAQEHHDLRETHE